jgi:hypothetical protein
MSDMQDSVPTDERVVPPTVWLPPGKTSAICFSIDDVHPGRSSDAYEAGGDLDCGVLGLIARLLARHPDLWVTLFTTADWREISPVPTRRLLSWIPVIRDKMMLAPILPVGAMRLDRHPAFVSYLKAQPRMEFGLHGLHHIHVGPHIYQEYQNETVEECVSSLTRAMAIFRSAGLPFVPGMTPPGWTAPEALLEAMSQTGLRFVASARDIKTEIAPGARADMSGLKGVSLLHPQFIANQLIHFPTNFQATSPYERAAAVLRAGGLLSIKAHTIKNAFGFIMLDGVDELYVNYLDLLFHRLRSEFDDTIWWTSMGQIAARIDAHVAACPCGVRSGSVSAAGKIHGRATP